MLLPLYHRDANSFSGAVMMRFFLTVRLLFVCSDWTHSASCWSEPWPSQDPASPQDCQTSSKGEASRGLQGKSEVTRIRSHTVCIPWFPALSLSDSSVTSSLRSCGCVESCISDLGGSDWFRQRYDPKQQPIIRDAKNNFDPDALKWWLVRKKIQKLTVAALPKLG